MFNTCLTIQQPCKTEVVTQHLIIYGLICIHYSVVNYKHVVCFELNVLMLRLKGLVVEIRVFCVKKGGGA